MLSVMELTKRGLRNRKSESIRILVRETTLSAGDFVYPLFMHEGKDDEKISSMPGCIRWSLSGLLQEAREAYEMGIPAIILFPKISDALKTPEAHECYNPQGLVPQAVRAIKAKLPELVIMTDIALDPYSSKGHDCLIHKGEILNDETVELLCKQALCHAEAGADVVAPSDMMDGRVGAIRKALDNAQYTNTSILSYSAKYASAFYGPFRGALDSAPRSGDKKAYQMNPSNVKEALREVALDEDEGADMVMVKPAGAYLDVISRVKDTTNLPVAAYQVSGEYLMLKSAAEAGWLDESAVILESLLGIKRAGADFILTYFAKEAARLLNSK